MRFITAFAFVATVTAAPLAKPQVLNGINDAIGDILSNIPFVGGISSGITDAIGDILNIPRGIAGSIAGGLDRDDYKRVQDALVTIKMTMQPYVPTNTATKRTEQDDPISDLVSGIPVVGPYASQITSGVNDLFGTLLSIPGKIVGDILDRITPEERETIKVALNNVGVVFKSHAQ